MQYRIDKISGNKLSVLGFGCMRFPGSLGRTDMQKTEELIMRSIEGGVNFFDTAWIYGKSEETLGEIFNKNNVRNKVHIATKLPLIKLKQAGDFDRFFYKQLERLRTDYIDYYMLHMLADVDMWNILKSWGIEEWFETKKKSGQIRQTGFSFHGPKNEFLKIIDDYDWGMCLIQYNYSDENFQAGVTGLKKASEKMPVMIMEPLLGGMLVKGIPKAAVDIFKKENPELTPAGRALNWVWNQKEVTLLLSGMENLNQLEENLRLADASSPGMLDGKDEAVYGKVMEIVNKACKIRCTGCNYCMPCPRGVNIPGSFSGYNAAYSMGYKQGMWQYITSVTSANHVSKYGRSPSLCNECGKCEPLCPQKLPIMQILKTVQKKMEPYWFKFGCFCAYIFMGVKKKKASDDHSL
jgi:predicted aldo/keto reductase-like oxidoreductase